MFLIDILYSTLASLGLYYKDAKILFLGLDNAGKSTLLYMLKENRIKSHEPTLHPGTDELIVGKFRAKVFDLGGHETARRLWQEYYASGSVDAVVFLVDANDRPRLEEAKAELNSLLSTDQLEGVPFLVLGNKIDVPTACSADELNDALGLTDLRYQNEVGKEDSWTGARPVELFMCSVVRRMGYADGFEWLCQFL